VLSTAVVTVSLIASLTRTFSGNTNYRSRRKAASMRGRFIDSHVLRSRLERRATMRVLYPRCCGLDVHKSCIAAYVLCAGPDRKIYEENRRFGTMTADLLDLAAWLQARGVQRVAMESTGVYWKPVWNILEGLELLLANAQQVKALPGRKTDQKDSQWLADLQQHGLLRPSFVPPRAIRELRDLTRGRARVAQHHSTVSNRIQKVLEDANIKLASVASDVLGVSGRQMLQASSKG
jgi:transposase